MKPRTRWPQRNMFGVIVAFVATICVAGSALAQSTGVRLRYVPNEYIIHVQPGTSTSDVQAQASRLGASVVKALPLSDTYLIRLGRTGTGGSSVGHGISKSSVRWTIDKVQPNFYQYKCATPTDPLWGKLWGMTMIHAPEAWDKSTGSASVTVAVVDSGVSEHPDLIDRLLDGKDFADPTNPNGHMDLDGHGTHVAGTIAAQGNNGIGVVGVCPDNVQILPVRVLDEEGSSTSDIITEGLNYVLTSTNADVVNMSLGGYGNDDLMHAAVRALVNAGVIVVCAAGNDATSQPMYPAGWSEVIAVSAVAPDESLSSFSNFGKIEIAAPGGDQLFFGMDAGGIWSSIVTWSAATPPVPTYGYGAYQGTSMACPHVAGAAALLLSYGVAPRDVPDRLFSTARPSVTGGSDVLKFGAGILDLHAAMSSATLKIVKPTRGSTGIGSPQFRFALKGIDTNTIKVYLDYPDANDDGVPDNLADTTYQIIDMLNVDTYLSNNDTVLSFNWPLPNKAPLIAGAHRVYISGNAALDGTAYRDWCSFYVSDRVIKAGIHLFAFPYWRSSGGETGTIPNATLPSNLLTEVGTANPVRFVISGTNRAVLTRWLPETSVTRSVPYFSHVENKPAELVTDADKLPWVQPMDSGFYTGGGFSTNDPDVFKFPAGAGYWLYLPKDAQVNQAYQTMPKDDSFNIYLYEGWNMIGNPFNGQVAWGNALFNYRGEGPKTLLEAEAAGWVKSNLFGWDSTNGRYVSVTGRDLLQPFEGYWLRAMVGSAAANDQLTVTLMP